ncbi:MAG TPA: sugar ABC transporter permease [Chitinivibrionales bacterium]
MTTTWAKKAYTHVRDIWPLFPAALYLLTFLIIVFVYLVGLSFSWSNGPTTIFPTIKPLVSVFANHLFTEAFTNTCLFVLIGTPFELLTGLFLALILYRSFFMRSVIRSIFLIPLAVPALVTAIVLFILFDFPGGHVNHLLLGKYGIVPAILPHPLNWRGTRYLALGLALLGKVWRDMPISMLILLAGLNSIDPELFNAAKTMGAGFRQRMRYIIVPLLIPSFATVILLRSIEMWKEFIFPFVLAGQYGLLGTLIESLYNDWGASHEAAVVALVLVLCIVITAFLFLTTVDFFRKRFAKRYYHVWS